MDPKTILNELQDFIDLLAGSELAISTTKVVMDWLRAEGFHRVTWANNATAPGDLFRRESGTIDEYLGWLSNGCYSAVLFDGSILQMSFDVDDTEIVGHRLLYFPCPFDLEMGLVNEMPLVDIVDAYCKDYGIHAVSLRSPVRFDYQKDIRRVGHPVSHMTFQWSHTRVPVGSALSLGHFVHFVFQNFYPRLWNIHTFINDWPVDYYQNTLERRENRYLHLDAYK